MIHVTSYYKLGKQVDTDGRRIKANCTHAEDLQ